MNLSKKKPVGCKFQPGQRVTFINENGISFPNLKIIGFAKKPLYDRSIYLNKESWWMPVSPNSLKTQ